MTEGAEGETYEAFKARAWQEFNSRYAGRTEAMQQRLLRVRLQHFLLTVGAEVDRGRQLGSDSDFVSPDENGSTNADEVTTLQSFAREQKRLAVAREAAKATRHMSARTIQKLVRCRRSLILKDDTAIADEEELPSTSLLIALVIEEPASSVKSVTVIAPAAGVGITPVDLPPSAALPSYEVVIELVAARGLALGSSSSVAFDGKYVEAELLLKRQSNVIARVVSTRQFVSAFQDSSAEIQLQDCSLRFAIDLNSDIQHGIASPQSVIDEWSATVIVKAIGSSAGSNASTLGVVEIPLSLLETPLAIQYALCRWFPMEKAYPGHAVRGDLRVSACYLMRYTSSDGIEMVPYVSTAISKTLLDETPIRQERKPTTRRMKKTPTEQNPLNKFSQRKRALQSSESGPRKSEAMKSPVLSLKDSMSSPIGRISRAEALSPPSSPSSVASSEAGEVVESPIVQRQAQTSQRFFPPKAATRQHTYSNPTESAPPNEELVVETMAGSPQSPEKPFLKRKPYKVVFHKLDWSRVSSKTDSNLPTNGSSRVNSTAASRPPKISRSASRSSSATAIKTPQTSNTSGDAGTSADLAITSPPGAFIDAHTAQRLAALETTMYERCCVTRETASLARFKYQTERKKFGATLYSQRQQTQLRGASEPSAEADQPTSQGSSEQHAGSSTTTDAAVTELWKRLTGDYSGELYAATLRSLLERPATLMEPSSGS